MKTWLKGGLFGIGAGIILSLLSRFIIFIYAIMFYINIPTIFITKLVYDPAAGRYLFGSFPVIFLIWLIYGLYWFVIGSIIGLIIQKIKR